MAKKTDIAAPAASDLVIDQDYAQQLLGGLLESRTTVLATGGGKPLLRLARDGEWIFGQGDDPVQEGSHWAINVRTLGWGSVCWTNYPAGQKNKRLGLVVAPMTQPKPPTPAPIEGFAFTDYICFDALCLDGDDEGLEVTYGSNSIGGMRAFVKLRDAIILQLQKDIRYPCPVVTLEQEDYKHSSYGKIFNPIFTITGWADLGGNLAPTGTAAAKPAPAASAPAAPAEPARKRKPPLGNNGTIPVNPADVAAKQAGLAAGMHEFKDANGPEVPDPAPVHTGQRRRHRPAA